VPKKLRPASGCQPASAAEASLLAATTERGAAMRGGRNVPNGGGVVRHHPSLLAGGSGYGGGFGDTRVSLITGRRFSIAGVRGCFGSADPIRDIGSAGGVPFKRMAVGSTCSAAESESGTAAEPAPAASCHVVLSGTDRPDRFHTCTNSFHALIHGHGVLSKCRSVTDMCVYSHQLLLINSNT
jgi:hypothetical protein